MAIVSNNVETLPKISIASVEHTNVTCRQTDRQTDGRRREHEFTLAKKVTLCLFLQRCNQERGLA